MHFSKFVLATLDSSNDPRYARKRLIKVKNSYFSRTLRIQLHFILRFDRSVVYEDGISFLDLDEGDVLMERCLDDRVSLMMLFHEHL